MVIEAGSCCEDAAFDPYRLILFERGMLMLRICDWTTLRLAGPTSVAPQAACGGLGGLRASVCAVVQRGDDRLECSESSQLRQCAGSRRGGYAELDRYDASSSSDAAGCSAIERPGWHSCGHATMRSCETVALRKSPATNVVNNSFTVGAARTLYTDDGVTVSSKPKRAAMAPST